MNEEEQLLWMAASSNALRESKDKALAKRARSKAAKRERDRPSSKKK